MSFVYMKLYVQLHQLLVMHLHICIYVTMKGDHCCTHTCGARGFTDFVIFILYSIKFQGDLNKTVRSAFLWIPKHEWLLKFYVFLFAI